MIFAKKWIPWRRKRCLQACWFDRGEASKGTNLKLKKLAENCGSNLVPNQFNCKQPQGTSTTTHTLSSTLSLVGTVRCSKKLLFLVWPSRGRYRLRSFEHSDPLRFQRLSLFPLMAFLFRKREKKVELRKDNTNSGEQQHSPSITRSADQVGSDAEPNSRSESIGTNNPNSLTYILTPFLILLFG